MSLMTGWFGVQVEHLHVKNEESLDQSESLTVVSSVW
jgi:hypothetical protein